jgi:alkanesulfonate monooxygenase SsuD/methylene tetrahydromethanopterin reductase-like flavin-dependent oxidoreductase (luciferase family)
MVNRTETIELGTRFALSFTRSPMQLAYLAWKLSRFAEGRFILGLGIQVKSHNEGPFSVEWTQPGPRLHEVVESLTNIFDVFQGRDGTGFPRRPLLVLAATRPLQSRNDRPP